MTQEWYDGRPVIKTLFDHIVAERAITDIDRFIQPTWPDSLHSPLTLPDMEKACQRIWQAIVDGETIGIMGDYDMDGTPAAAIMASFLALFAIKPKIILPTRKDGYGFSPSAVDQFVASNVTLIITVDCGIRDAASVVQATQRKCDVIITDHHECPAELPQAHAVVNPKRSDSSYLFDGLCGTAIAFKLVQALIITAPEKFKSTIPKAFAEWLLDLVALATVADMVPLTSENRTLVYYGLKVLRRGGRPGIRRLIQALDLSLETLDTSDISFRIVPKCNACGRLDQMDDVYALLTSQDAHTIEQSVQTILKRGVESQKLLAQMVESAQKKLENRELASVVVLADDTWLPGLTGLVAARLVELLERPVAVLAGVDETLYRGSMRSAAGVNLVSLLDSVSSTLEHFGGHEKAAGLTLRRNNLDDFRLAITSQPMEVEPVSFTTDGTISVTQVTTESLDSLSQLKPWGVGNDEPIWSINNVALKDSKWLSEGKHVRAIIQSGDATLPLIYFNAESMRPWLNDRLDLCGSAAINEFRGHRTPQFQVRSFRPANKV